MRAAISVRVFSRSTDGAQDPAIESSDSLNCAIDRSGGLRFTATDGRFLDVLERQLDPAERLRYISERL
jgi:hypothetical protein